MLFKVLFLLSIKQHLLDLLLNLTLFRNDRHTYIQGLLWVGKFISFRIRSFIGSYHPRLLNK
jgi:hypothetical protein